MHPAFDPHRATWTRAQHYDRSRFCTLVDHHGPGHAGYLLGVPRLTLSRWLTGQSAVPHAAGALLWHLSAWGKTTQDIERENALATLRGLTEALRTRVARLEADLVLTARLVPPGAANDAWACPSDPRSGIYRASSSSTPPPRVFSATREGAA